MTDKSLGHGGVDAVHGHVIAVIGGPAQSQFGHVAGADDHAAALVGNVHEHLGTLSGLTVFVGHIMAGRILLDIPKMQRHCLFDIHLF